MSFHFPLINRSGQKKSIIETLGFWDMDLQLGKPLQFFENHHQTCIQLEVINQKIRKWLDFSESELVSIFTVLRHFMWIWPDRAGGPPDCRSGRSS
ncbi:hypothetical protein, partial [uncultured Kushneria sp.]|uniref:hypothetical protein n=1 Tax=uncultured Kushneria sp. TaxID=905033 RepID=UPI0026137AEA